MTKAPDEIIAALRSAFAGRLLTEPAEMAPFLLDHRKRYQGRALAVAQPDSAPDVASLLRACAARGIPVVPQGGNTGLSGGSVPDDSGQALVLSLARLNRIRALDPVNNTVTVEAGCVLQTLQQRAEEAGRLFPLSLAAEGSCTIGGNLATNAGGVQVLRYGTARELCLGLEVVTADGQLWEGLRGLRKDNTGYDLRDLFIGSEGTLGVITAAVLKLFPQPAARASAFVALDSPDDALRLLAMCQQSLGFALSAFELLSETCMGLVLKHFTQCRRPLEQSAPWYALIEVSDMEGEAHALAALESALAPALEEGLARDAAISSSIAQHRAFWALRENVSEAQAHEGKNIKHDVAVPISRMGEFITLAGARLTEAFPGVRLVVFGHLGDGNLHFNVSPPEGASGVQAEAAFLAQQDAINQVTHDTVAQFQGSISAEHGLGVLRRDEAARYKSAVELDLMGRLKRAFDPHGLMNPGKVLRTP